MPMKITKADAHRAVDRLNSIKQRIAKVQRQAEERVEQVVRSAEVVGSAFAVGVMQGRTGGIEVVGVPLELGAGLALEILGHLDFAGRASGHLVNIGDGALSAYATTLGRGVGQEWASKGSSTHTSGTRLGGGRPNGGLPNGLNDQEIAAAARMAQQVPVG